MTTPPPSPFRHFRTYLEDPYESHTSFTESSYDGTASVNGSNRYSEYYSDRYSDISSPPSQHLRPHIETRRPSFPEPDLVGSRVSLSGTSATASTMESNENKDYLYFVFSKAGSKWDEEPFIDEIPAPQSQIKRKAESISTSGTAIEQLRKMGPNRLGHIDRHTKLLNAGETDGSVWEPVFLDNKRIKQKGRIIEVKSFEIVFAKRRPEGKESGGLPKQPLKPESEAAKAEKLKKERRKSRDLRTSSTTSHGLVDDPFGQTSWFDMTGAAAGGHGASTSGLPGLPPSIPAEKPIAARAPRIIAGLDPDNDPTIALDALGFGPSVGAGLGLGATGATRSKKIPGLDGDIVTIKEDRHDARKPSREGRERKTWSLSRSRSRSRSGRHASLRPSVRFSDHFVDGTDLSCSSSQTSGEAAIIFDEVEELSSHTSEDTTSRSPSGRRSQRVVTTPFKQHRPGPTMGQSGKQYELNSKERIFTAERARRRSSRLDRPHTDIPFGAEQHKDNTLVRRNTSPRHKPTIHQAATLPTPLADVPPIAVYPDELGQEREEEDEHLMNYMRNTTRRQTLREQEDDMAQREQAVRERETMIRMEQDRRQRETTALRDELETLRLGTESRPRKSTYTFEPRDHYKAGRF